MPNSSNFFTKLASVYLDAGRLNLSRPVMLTKSNSWPFDNGGNNASPSDSAFSSSISSSSLPSKYTFKKPSNFITSPLAVRVSLLVEISIFAVVFSNCASLICEAMVRFQINSYNLFVSVSSTLLSFI